MKFTIKFFLMPILAMVGFCVSAEDTVMLTGFVRFAEKVTVEREPQMRYVLEVIDSAHDSWPRKYVDVRVVTNDIAKPLLFNKDELLIVSGARSKGNVDVLYSSLVHSTDEVELNEGKLLPIWMTYYRERLQRDLQAAFDDMETTMIENLPPVQFRFMLNRDRTDYHFIEFNRFKDHPLMPLLEFQMIRTMRGLEGMVPEIFSDYFQISIKDKKVLVEKERRTKSLT